ncbi:MAG TPA: hemerythrin domain-containing protein, partial [Gammaproteobacteria bacterium]|nr:hemerythrin domain-containing protein [Gammaproteobacteria bacterium]
HWIAPGSRWRVARLAAAAAFELEIHADETVAAAAPQAVRAALLDDPAVTQVDSPAGLARALEALEPGDLTLLRAGFDCSVGLQEAMHEGGGVLFWHPLETGPDRFAALIGRSSQPVGLTDYLGRDHAVIESVLAGTLRGNREHAGWLHNVLARHLSIEEELLFPAYLDAGGRPGWVRGLCSEHEHLRHHVQHLGDAVSRRRFLLLLDGHDEKEEKIVYPDILERLSDQAESLIAAILQRPLAPDSIWRLPPVTGGVD